jgi:uncharacterized protein (DUF983 family)
MGRPPTIPPEKKTRIVLAILAGEMAITEAQPIWQATCVWLVLILVWSAVSPQKVRRTLIRDG